MKRSIIVIREGKANIRSIHAVIIRSNKEVSSRCRSGYLGHPTPQLGQSFSSQRRRHTRHRYVNYLPLSPNGIVVGGVDIAVPEVGFMGGSCKSRKSHKSHKKPVLVKADAVIRKPRHIRRGATMVDSAHRSSSTSVAI